MQKLVKYVPSGSVSTPITFPSSKGSITFQGVGDEKIISLEQFEALVRDSKEFKTCIEMRVIITSNVATPITDVGTKAEEKLTDTDEQLSATPKKSSKSS